MADSNPPKKSPTPDAILRLPEVEKTVGMKRSTIYRHMESGTFPQAVPLGTRHVGWLESEVQAWIQGRVAARDNAAKVTPKMFVMPGRKDA